MCTVSLVMQASVASRDHVLVLLAVTARTHCGERGESDNTDVVWVMLLR